MGLENCLDHKMPFLASNGFHKLCYREWGRPRNRRVLICVHGLSRNRLDFDQIAEQLSDYCRVLAVDIPGRGGSDWMPNPRDYRYPFFESLLGSVIAVTGAESVDWIGTSMGGILGMGLTGRPGSSIRRLVLNDIGPFISAEARAANTNRAASASVYDTEDEAIKYVLEPRKTFGPFTKKAARKFARDSLVRSADGKWRLHYDPRIIDGREDVDVDMWDLWSRISIPVLTLWGVESTILSAETVERMRATGPRSEIHAIEDVGHCPGLTTEAEIERVRKFLVA